jgi:hypothetical protein
LRVFFCPFPKLLEAAFFGFLLCRLRGGFLFTAPEAALPVYPSCMELFPPET